MPQKSLATLLQSAPETLTMSEQYRLMSACLRASDQYTPFHILLKRELPPCGARCRDGHRCKAKATRDVETGCYVRNGRCRLHGGLSTGPTTTEGKQRVGEAARRRAQHTRLGDRQAPAPL
jgi:hypothetical protein